MRRRDLAAVGCGNPDCDHDHRIIYFHGRCHTNAGTWTFYDKQTGRLTIECAECETPIVQIDVAA